MARRNGDATDLPPCVPWPVQLRHTCPLSGEAYVARTAWRDASLATCPRHPRGGCGLVRHGTYPRRTPTGMRIARYYCPTAHETFSLLPDCLASHFPGALDPIEQVVATVETARSVEAAADILRPDITLPSAVRWIRRRLTPVRRALLAIVTLVPDLFTGDARLAAVRLALATPSALVALRTHAAPHLATLPTPVGFHPRASRRDVRASAAPHGMGADRAGPSR
jgi:transposase-like protein